MKKFNRTMFAMSLLMTSIIAPAKGEVIIEKSTVLTTDLMDSVIITNNNIQLNCAGHSLIGTPDLQGIKLQGRTGVTIKNCNIIGFLNGIDLHNSNDNQIKNNNIYGSFVFKLKALG